MRLLYRADGGHPVGTGHIFRAVRILRALSDQTDLQADLMVAEDAWALRTAATAPARILPLPPRRDPDAIKPRLEARPVLDQLARQPYDVVVVDMLDTPETDMAAVAAVGPPVVTLDDRGAGRRHARAIVNVLVEEPEPAALSPGTALLQGGPYVVLDPAFAAAHASRDARDVRELRKVFVTMGGADAAGLTVKVARALRSVEHLDSVEFGCGPAFPHGSELTAELTSAPWSHRVLRGLPNLIDRYNWADLVLVAGGLSMYEVCCVGAPALAVCQPIDHQLELAEILTAAGAMATVGYGLEASEAAIGAEVSRLRDVTARREMCRRGPALVDGDGAARVAAALIDIGRGALPRTVG